MIILLCCHCYKSEKEGWLSPTERESVSAISLSHNLATSGEESCRYVVAFTRFAGGGIRLPQESLRHILASPGYASGTIAVNVTWMERGINACQMHRSMYPSIFNHFPVIEPISLKVCHFTTFFAHFGLPEYPPGTIAVTVTILHGWKEDLMLVKCIAACTYLSSTVSQ